MKRILSISIFFLIVTAAAYSIGDERRITLPNVQTDLAPGAGKEKVSTLCNICHSVDYITMQPLGTRAQWAATVSKMIKVFGAPINESDEKIIISYLFEHYGAGK
ncbi:MAG TPA: hypothetical protein VK452_01280 [Dissulfurispiraceae bacterium]|nr:hypothetical protein [Dissulfurispiraceae bacterium]